MAWEALNNIAGGQGPAGWSSWSTTTAGPTSRPSAGWPTTWPRCGVSQRYEQVLDYIKTTLSRAPLVGAPLFGTLHGIKKGLKDVLQPQVLFEDLGPEVPRPGRRPRRAGGRAGAAQGPRLRRPGAGARDHHARASATRWPSRTTRTACTRSARPRRRPERGDARPQPWTEVFGRELAAIGADRPDVVAITAAMLHPTGLNPFAAAYPDRVFDVGHRRAARGDQRRPAWPWAACTRWWRSTRRS